MLAIGVDINEEELINQLRSKDDNSFEWIFRTYHSALVFFANRLLSNDRIEEAEEVVLDVLMKFYERRTNFDRLSAIKAFLYISTKNACLQILEKDQVRMRRFQDYRFSYSDIQNSVLDDMVYSEVLREVADAIETLPPQCKVVMKLFFEEAKTAREIAEMLGITISTVNNQKAKAISILRRRLSTKALTFVSLFF